MTRRSTTSRNDEKSNLRHGTNLEAEDFFSPGGDGPEEVQGSPVRGKANVASGFSPWRVGPWRVGPWRVGPWRVGPWRIGPWCGGRTVTPPSTRVAHGKASKRDGTFRWAMSVFGRRHLVLRLCAYLGVGLTVLIWSLWAAGLRWQWSPSGPQWIYRLTPAPTLKPGAWVAVCLDGPAANLALHRAYVHPSDDCPSGIEPILKRVWAVEGQRVDLDALPEPLDRDALGRPLDAATRDVVGPGEVWLRSIYDSPSTYDSKYYGPVPVDWIRWSAVPLLWRGPPPSS